MKVFELHVMVNEKPETLGLCVEAPTAQIAIDFYKGSKWHFSGCIISAVECHHAPDNTELLIA